MSRGYAESAWVADSTPIPTKGVPQHHGPIMSIDLDVFDEDLCSIRDTTGAYCCSSRSLQDISVRKFRFSGANDEFLDIKYTKERDCHYRIPWTDDDDDEVIAQIIDDRDDDVESHENAALTTTTSGVYGTLQIKLAEAKKPVPSGESSYFNRTLHIISPCGAVLYDWKGYSDSRKFVEKFCHSANKRFVGIVENYEDGDQREDPSIVVLDLRLLFPRWHEIDLEIALPFLLVRQLLKRISQSRAGAGYDAAAQAGSPTTSTNDATTPYVHHQQLLQKVLVDEIFLFRLVLSFISGEGPLLLGMNTNSRRRASDGGQGEGNENPESKAALPQRASQLLYLTPPVFDERDEKRHNYGLVHLATTLTIAPCFHAIVHLLLPAEAAQLQQARKLFGMPVEIAAEQLARHIHQQLLINSSMDLQILLHDCLERIPVFEKPQGKGGGGAKGGRSKKKASIMPYPYLRFLHELLHAHKSRAWFAKYPYPDFVKFAYREEEARGGAAAGEQTLDTFSTDLASTIRKADEEEEARRRATPPQFQYPISTQFADFMCAPFGDDLCEVPGISPESRKCLEDVGVSTAYQLYAMCLSYKSDTGMPPMLHADRFFQWLKFVITSRARRGRLAQTCHLIMSKLTISFPFLEYDDYLDVVPESEAKSCPGCLPLFPAFYVEGGRVKPASEHVPYRPFRIKRSWTDWTKSSRMNAWMSSCITGDLLELPYIDLVSVAMLEQQYIWTTYQLIAKYLSFARSKEEIGARVHVQMFYEWYVECVSRKNAERIVCTFLDKMGIYFPSLGFDAEMYCEEEEEEEKEEEEEEEEEGDAGESPAKQKQHVRKFLRLRATKENRKKREKEKGRSFRYFTGDSLLEDI